MALQLEVGSSLFKPLDGVNAYRIFFRTGEGHSGKLGLKGHLAHMTGSTQNEVRRKSREKDYQ